jgi:DNA invertase Pin-like site-specific DNA recombinase
MRAVGYVRVSTETQGASGLGLEAQRAAIGAEAERRGWDIEVAEEVGSGRSVRERPVLRGVLGGLRRGDALVVAKMDRLSRSVGDAGKVLDEARRKGWNLVVLDLGLDLSTPTGEAMANMLATFAQLERRLIGQRIKEAFAAKRERGDPNQYPPETRRLVMRLRGEGFSLRGIATELERRRVPAIGKRWHLETVARIVRAEA